MENKIRLAEIELSRAGEDHDVTGFVYIPNRKEQWLLGETYSECWVDATKWLVARGVVLDQDYEIEYEKGGGSYVYHEQY